MPPRRLTLSAAYGQLPLSFEINKGQTDPRVNFLTQGAGYTAFLTPTEAVMELQQGSGGNVVAMKLVGANPGSHAVGLDKQAGVSNDFAGNDPVEVAHQHRQLRRGGLQGCLPRHQPGLPRRPAAARVRLRGPARREPRRHPAGV